MINKVVMGFAMIALLLPISHARAAGAEIEHVVSETHGTSVYAAADEAAAVVGTLSKDEKATPIAETQSAGGIKWYLIKTKSGVVGWIRHRNDAQSKSAETFFRSLPTQRVTIPVDSRKSLAAAARGEAVIIPVTLLGRSVIVPVTLNHSVNANLLLDTGASITMISRRVATALALPSTGAGLFSGIGGTVSAPVARVESIKVGDAEVSGMTVSIHDVARFPQFEGLLGMDFLGRFQISVDWTKQLLVLTRK
jgi:hypothetical protein